MESQFLHKTPVLIIISIHTCKFFQKAADRIIHSPSMKLNTKNMARYNTRFHLSISASDFNVEDQTWGHTFI